MLQTESQLGPYTLVKTLGRGSFGEVWLAERRGQFATTQVAVKIPLDEEPDLVAVRQEAHVWQLASGHPNVIPVIDADVYDGHIAIVTEYAPDGTLLQWLRAHDGKAPSLETAIHIACGILAGLEHLHERRIVHRDLKPGNILMQGETPRLTDFGLSRVLKSSATTQIAGTGGYMAPEMFRGKYSPQSDIWAAGVILYRLLTGEMPFHADNFWQLKEVVDKQTPRSMPADIPERVQNIVRRALAKSPTLRFETANEMRQALQKAYALHAIAVPVSQSTTATRTDLPSPTQPDHPSATPAPKRDTGLKTAATVSEPSPRTLQYPAPETDPHLSAALQNAQKLAQKEGISLGYLTRSFADGHYPEHLFRTMMKIVRQDKRSLKHEQLLCAWFLGFVPLQTQHRDETARSLRTLLNPKARTWKDYLPSAAVRSIAMGFIGTYLYFCGMSVLSINWAAWANIGIGGLALDFLFFGPYFTLLTAIPACLVLFPIMTLVLQAIDKNSIQPVRMMAGRSLERMGSIESLGTLARACLDNNLGVQRIARESFRELLNGMKPEHFALLNVEAVADILELLSQSSSELVGASAEKSVLEVFRCVERTGDERSIAFLRKIATEGKVPRWKSDARLVLDALQARKRDASPLS